MAQASHKNSFDLLRIIFATSVLFTHAYPIAGLDNNDFLGQISHDTFHYPSVAVPGFFIISGYLVIQSLHRSSSANDYLLRRFARIYPGLFVMLFLTVSLGWAVYSGSFTKYVFDRQIYIFFAKNMLMLHKHMIYGFFASSPAAAIVNVSIWSIPYEVIFYLILISFFKIPKQKHFAVALGAYVFLLLNFILTYHQIGIPNKSFQNISVYNIFKYGSFFFGGVALGLKPDFARSYRKILLPVFSILLIVLFCCSSLPFYLLNLFLPLFVISLSMFEAPVWINNILQKTGDPSYGIYIYGFTVQQTLYYFFKPNYWQLAVLSVLVLTIIGICSWKFIEKPSLLFFRKRLALKGQQFNLNRKGTL